MRIPLVAVLLFAGALGLWLLDGDLPQQQVQSDGDTEAMLPIPPKTVQLAGTGVQPVNETIGETVEKPGHSGSPPPPRASRGRPRDRAGSGNNSARVRIVDGAGKPVVGARVIAILKKLPLQARPPGPLAHTDKAGHSMLRGLSEGQIEKLLVIPPKGREDLARYTLPTWTGEDAVVTLPQGYTLACVVRDHNGKPIPHARVMIRDPEFGDTGQATDADGRYRFVQLPEGSYEVRASVGTRVGKLVRAKAGGPEVVLELDNRGHATIRIEGWSPGTFEPIGRLESDPLKGPSHPYMHVSPVKGVITIRGANPDAVYSLWLGTRKGTSVVYETGLRIDGREIVVRPQPAFNISGRLIAPPGAEVTAINVKSAGVFLKGKWVGTETYEVRGLPKGTWTIWAMGKCPDGRLSGYVQARAGGTADLELKLRR